MNIIRKVLIASGLAAVMLISWMIVLTSKPDVQKQAELMSQARVYMDDMVYVRAKPLLEEAAVYSTKNTAQAKIMLKEASYQLKDNKTYTRMLNELMEQEDAGPEIYREAAEYYLNISRYQDAMEALAAGVEKTNDASLTDYYESVRYKYQTSYSRFEYISQIYKGTAAVSREGKWGIANVSGKLMIPCEYEKISNLDKDSAIVKKDGEIYAVNSKNQRSALLKPKPNASGAIPAATDFTNLSEGRVGLCLDGGWYRSTPEFVIGTAVFEEIGVYSGGYAAVKTDGKWGISNMQSEFLVKPVYGGVKMDEIGRCYARGVAFIQNGGSWFIAAGDTLLETAYEDAKPFADGYAAVKLNGKWGFADVDGTLVIQCQFDDALSFGMHLAAVKNGDKWGYINKRGEWAIEPEFLQAKSFSGGCAPVELETGWTFITLEEYKKGGALLG